MQNRIALQSENLDVGHKINHYTVTEVFTLNIFIVIVKYYNI